MNEEDFFAGLAPAEAEAAPIDQVQPTIEAPIETVVQPVIETPAAPVEVRPESKPEPGHVPITALLDEREKRKELERQLASLREQQPAPTMPDPLQDPHAYSQQMQQQLRQLTLDARLDMSETAARRHFGADVTDAAKAWALGKFGSNPAFQAEVLGQPDPYGYAVEAFNRDQIASQVTPDAFAEFQAWKSAQAQIAAAPVATPQLAAATPTPRSIASAPSSGGMTSQPISTEEMFAAAIK